MKPYAAMKTRFLLRGMSFLNFDAINFGCSEAILSRFYYDKLRQEAPEAMALVISANVFLTTSPQTLAFPDSRLLTRLLPDGKSLRMGVIGVTVSSMNPVSAPPLASNAHPTGDFLITPILPALQPVVARLRSQADLLIVLVHGTSRDCIPLARALPEVDRFIASTPDAPNQTTPLPPDLANRIAVVGSTKGRQVGRLRLDQSSSGKWSIGGTPEYISVSTNLPPDPKLVKLLDEYKQTTRQFLEMPRPNAALIYVGSPTCARCHPREYKDWLSSKHARALDSLTDRNQQFNPECLPCHTLGFRHENGFYSVTLPQSEIMGNVQCENCHGPSRRHAQTQIRLENNPLKRLNHKAYAALETEATKNLPRREVPAAECQKCHELEHDDHFDYKLKASKVNHLGTKRID